MRDFWLHAVPPTKHPRPTSSQWAQAVHDARFPKRRKIRPDHNNRSAPCYWPFDIVSGGIPPNIPPEELRFWGKIAENKHLTAFIVAFEWNKTRRVWEKVPAIKERFWRGRPDWQEKVVLWKGVEGLWHECSQCNVEGPGEVFWDLGRRRSVV